MADEEENTEDANIAAATQEGDGEGDGEPPKKSKKLIIIIAAVVVLLILVGVGLMMSGVFSSKDTPAPAKDPAHEAPTTGASEELAQMEAVADTGESFFYEVPELLVNLNSSSKRKTFLKMTVNLEVGNQLDFATLDKVLPKVIDNFQVYLRELRPEDMKGSEGIYRLREELLLRVNLAAKPVVVKDVLFLNILTQ